MPPWQLHKPYWYKEDSKFNVLHVISVLAGLLWFARVMRHYFPDFPFTSNSLPHLHRDLRGQMMSFPPCHIAGHVPIQVSHALYIQSLRRLPPQRCV
jgi:hypothetical protein